MEFRTSRIKNYTVLAIHGEIDYFNIDEFKKEVLALPEGNDLHVIIDLENITFIDSSGIGTLVICHRAMKKKGGSLSLYKVPPDIMVLIKMSTIDQFISIYQSENEIPEINY